MNHHVEENAWKKFAGFFKKPAVRKTGVITLKSIKWLIISGIISGFLAGGAAFGYLAAVVKDDPVRSSQFINEQINENIITGFVHFNDGTLIGQFRTEEDRRLAKLDEIPQTMINATIAIEDSDFYQHHGVNYNSFLRAVKQKLLNEDVQTGGSTITQQLARRVFLTLDRDLSRKFKEILLSIRLERMLSKDQILLAYLNKIPYGNGSNGYVVYGIKAAAKGLFDKDNLNDLNIAQSAYLAGLPQLPSDYSAFTGKGQFDPAGFDRAIKRQRLVLKRMLQVGKIDQKQYDEALAFDIKASLAKPSKKAYTTYPYLMMEVEERASEVLVGLQYPNLKLDTDAKKEAYNEALKDARSQLLRGGYHVYTTIDKTIYDSMQVIAHNKDNFSKKDPVKGDEQIGAMMINNKDGAILGMIEGRDFYEEQLNHATQAYRQPGSTMKPIAAYIPALEKGLIQPASVIDDVPIILPDGQKGVHLPENWDGGFHGLISARTALNQSYNIPAIKLFLYSVGIDEAWNFARQLGITSITEQDRYAQTGVIGGLYKGVSVEEMTNAYSSIPDKGVFYDAYLISKITDTNGKVIYEHEAKPTRVYSEETAYLAEDMLRTVITDGTAKDIKSKFKYYNKVAVSGKTGSTQEDADAWFMGFTPDITMGVWAGYEKSIYKLSKRTGGTNRAKNIWALVMNAAYEKRPELFSTKKFERPANIVQMTVSSVSGKLPNALTTAAGKTTTDLFNTKYVPIQEDDVMVKMKVISYNGVNYVPQPGTPDDFLQEKVVIRREKPISQILSEVKAAMDKLPEKDRKPIERFIPRDSADDAPSEPDPRVDDGKTPPAPTGVLVTSSGGENRISFQTQSTADLVGYRLYRSDAAGNFDRIPGKVLIPGQEPIFTDTPGGSGPYGYYVTAVDVAGNESGPSQAVFTDGSSHDMNQLPDLGFPMDGQNPADGSQMNAPDSGIVEASTPPETPERLKASAKGLAVQLTWRANPKSDRVSKYTVYYSDQADGDFVQIGSTSGTEFIYYALTDGGYYKVSASNSKGESPLSKAVKFSR